MAVRKAVITSLLTGTAFAGVMPIQALSRTTHHTVKKYTAHMSDIPTKLNTSAVVKTYTVHKSSASKFHPAFDYAEGECLAPANGAAPVPGDCEALCNYVRDFQGPVQVQPFDEVVYEEGFCAFGIANLEPCATIYFDPLNVLSPWCDAMHDQCSVNGYDGFIRFTGPSFAVALTGTPAAPPYGQQPCT